MKLEQITREDLLLKIAKLKAENAFLRRQLSETDDLKSRVEKLENVLKNTKIELRNEKWRKFKIGNKIN